MLNYTDASATKAMLATIDELSEAELAWQAPDISDSFTRLRRIMNRDQSGGSATAPDAGNPGSGENAAAAAQGGA